ncbi:hypothetical protein LK12_07820 [Novosphingobium malaysiense]|uniref:SnoaL-like domain-containing protein n=2 Tax=Novosphingobium malaysiense TaxID=1348853 RepID=A0A0B1ZT86_9SPHN|nr:hypothetical protein LK12_07820 [Novosphingobium malaysiense]
MADIFGAEQAAQLRDIVARRDIFELLCTYMRAQDRLLPELHRSVFHDDAYVDCGPFAGDPDGFVNFAQTLLGDMIASQHGIMQAHISVTGKRASGEVYFIAQHRIVEDEVEKDLFVAGRYIDEYEDRGAGWKILKRREVIDWARTDPATDSFLGQMTLTLGGRHGADFSEQRNWPV